MAFMARRPPSLIALGDAEIQPFLQAKFLQSLVLQFDNLKLHDFDDPSYSDAEDNDDNGDSSSTNSHDEILTNSYTTEKQLPGTGAAFSQPVGGSLLTLAPQTPFLAAGMIESAHQTSDPNNPSIAPTLTTTTATTNQNLPSLRHRGRSPSSLNIPPRRVTFSMAPQTAASKHSRQKENHRQSHRHTMQEFPDVKSRLSTAQKPRLSLGAIPDMTTNSVPLRDLALASTKSYEAVLAATMISPFVTTDPIDEYGTIQPDSVFNEPSVDRDGV